MCRHKDFVKKGGVPMQPGAIFLLVIAVILAYGVIESSINAKKNKKNKKDDKNDEQK